MAENKLYPVFLKLKNRKVLVVGGGFIALQKISGLINTEARLVVLAPQVIEDIKELQGNFPNFRKIEFIERDYQYGDELESFLVIAATDLPELNNTIANRCRDQGILVNSVDEPEHCDFYIPSIIESEDIKIGISTNGKAPSVSQKIRLDLQKLIDEKYQGLVEIIHNFRQKVKNKISGKENFGRRSRLIRWFTTRNFKKLELKK